MLARFSFWLYSLTTPRRADSFSARRSNRRGYVAPPHVDVATGWQVIADRIAERGEIGFCWKVAYRFWVHGERARPGVEPLRLAHGLSAGQSHP